MLRKLIKHEFLAMARYFIPMYIMLIVFSPLVGLMIRLANQVKDNDENIAYIISTVIFSIIGYSMLLLCAYLATYILIGIRFYKTVATSEGYLTFTLPAKIEEIVAAKMIASFVWIMSSVIVVAISLTCLVSIASSSIPSEYIKEVTEQINSVTLGLFEGDKAFLFILTEIVGYVFAGISAMAIVFTAIALGQMFDNNRIILSIAIFFGITMGIGILKSIFGIPLSMGIYRNMDILSSGSEEYDKLHMGLRWLEIGKDIFVSVAGFITTTVVFKKKLNVH